MKRVYPPSSLDCDGMGSVGSSPWTGDATPHLWRNESWYDRQIAVCFWIRQTGNPRISWSGPRSADMYRSTLHFWQVRHFLWAPTCLWLSGVCYSDSGMCRHWIQSWSSRYHRLHACQSPRSNRCRHHHHLPYRCSLMHFPERLWAMGRDKSGRLPGSRARMYRGSGHLSLQ